MSRRLRAEFVHLARLRAAIYQLDRARGTSFLSEFERAVNAAQRDLLAEAHFDLHHGPGRSQLTYHALALADIILES